MSVNSFKMEDTPVENPPATPRSMTPTPSQQGSVSGTPRRFSTDDELNSPQRRRSLSLQDKEEMDAMPVLTMPLMSEELLDNVRLDVLCPLLEISAVAEDGKEEGQGNMKNFFVPPPESTKDHAEGTKRKGETEVRPGGTKLDDLRKELDKLQLSFVKKDPGEVKERWLEVTGTGSSKKRAKTEAAFNMLELVEARIAGNSEATSDVGNRLKRLRLNEAGTSTAVSELQEFCQKYVRNTPEYKQGSIVGANFKIVCRLHGMFSGGSGGDG